MTGIKIYATTAAVFLGTLFSAQTTDAKSKSLLDNVKRNYDSKKNNYFKFIYGTGKGKVTKNQPGIFYSSGDKYRLKIMGIEQIFDGNKIYNISDDETEVTIAKPNPGSALFSPINYLTSYGKTYNIRYMGKKNLNGKNLDLVKMTPVKKNGIEAVYLYVDGSKNELVKLEQFGDYNDVAVIAITNYVANQSLRPDMFSFNKGQYKNYIITEL